ncbi:MAG: glycosyltransferase family 4 protein [Syntrophotaleaceae bacterium]
MTKKILFISYPYKPNSSAGAVRSERLATHLASEGWEVDVVTIRPLGEPISECEKKEKLSSLRITRTKTIDPWLRLQQWKPKNWMLKVLRSLGLRVFSFPDHMVFWIPFVVLEGLKIQKKRGFNAIYTTSPPHSTHLAGVILSKFSGKPLVADFRDPWTLNVYCKDDLNRRFLFFLERAFEKLIIKNASVLFANTRANQNQLCSAFPSITDNKVYYLPNGMQKFELPNNTVISNDYFTIVHTGTFYPNFKPYGLLEALARWKQGCQPPGIPEFHGIKLKLIGCSDMVTKKIVSDLDLVDDVSFEPWVPLEEARRIMCCADALWVTLGTGKEAASYVPSKLFEYIAAQRPIYGFFPPGEASSILKNTGTGFVFEKDDCELVISVLFEAIQSKKEGKAFPEFYRRNEEAVGELDVEKVLERFQNILSNIIKISY